ncbi:Hpt domain-containing protein [Massilia sp. LjRoot122]|uniref:Hpt domain-containing protein n=1 Tax=Massilia sp. LjRoot122 TaxID=3342257 RepID=UPI003ED117B6
MNPLPASASPDPAPALDSAAGLERMMGDRAMYLRVLTRFRSDYADNVARLRAAIAAGDTTLAHRIAHTLKGAAAMIEARGLRALAVDVEQLLRAGAPAAPQLLDRLEAELARVIAHADGLIVAPAANIPPEEAATLAESDIAQLRMLLDLGDSGAQDFMAEKRAGLRTHLGAARMAELEAALRAFDYERALSMLDARSSV